jgi:hypothetical protein
MRQIIVASCLLFAASVKADIPKYLTATPYDVVVPILNGDPAGASRISGQLYYDASTNRFKGVDNTGAINEFVTSGSLPSAANQSLSNLSSVAINTNLLPDSTSNNRDIGAPTKAFNVVFSQTSKAMLYYIRNSVTGDDRAQIRGDGGTTPSGNSVQIQFSNDGLGEAMGWYTGGSPFGSQASGSIYIETGNKTGGTGDSGDIQLYIGTSAGGNVGHIKMIDGSEGNIGDVWTSTNTDGSGRWQRIMMPQGTADPGSNIEGDVYYNTSTHKLRLRTDTAWVDLN